MKEPDLGPAKFICYLRGKPANHEPRIVTIQRVAKSKQDAAEHAHLDLVPIDASAPGTSACFLQVWEADHFASYYTTIGESPKTIRANRLIGSIPGAIAVHHNGHRFIAHGPPLHTHPADERNGSITLTLHLASGDTEDVELALPDYEGVLELFLIIKRTATSPDLAAFKYGEPHQVHNVRATLLRQIERRGGIHVAIVSDYDFDKANSNDKEFRRQADAMVPQLPSIILKEDGSVGFGRYEVKDRGSIKLKLQEARDACQTFLGLATAPLVGSLGIYGHGVPRGVQVGRNEYGAEASLNIVNANKFVRDNKHHFSPTVVVALFACNSGRGGGMDEKFVARRSKKQAMAIYGQVPVGEEHGAESYAWHLTQELVREGVPTPTVWAHTIAAHTTRNRRLSVLSPVGSADFTSLLFGVRTPDAVTRKAYLDRTDNNIHRLNLIRMVHLHSALYMPWEWAGRAVEASHPGYHPVAAQEAKALLAELRAEIVGEDSHLGGGVPEVVGLNEAGTHIVCSLVYGPDAKTPLSEHFSLEDFTRFDAALPLPLDLVRKLQMIRHSVALDFEVAGLSREPATKTISVTLKSATGSRDKLMSKAVQMRDRSLCFTDVQTGDNAEEFVVRSPE